MDLFTATENQLDRWCQPVRFQGRRQRGLNLLRAAEEQLFFAVLRGDHLLNGFRNRDVRAQLYPRSTQDACDKRCRTARVSRLIHLLRAHGLVAKIPHSFRYRITEKGHAVLSTAIDLRYQAFSKKLRTVA